MKSYINKVILVMLIFLGGGIVLLRYGYIVPGLVLIGIGSVLSGHAKRLYRETYGWSLVDIICVVLCVVVLLIMVSIALSSIS